MEAHAICCDFFHDFSNEFLMRRKNWREKIGDSCWKLLKGSELKFKSSFWTFEGWKYDEIVNLKF